MHILYGQKQPPEKLPAPVVALLKNDAPNFAGVGMDDDCSRIEMFFGMTVVKTVGLVTPAHARKAPLRRKRGLTELCSHLLGRPLSKDPSVKLSKWNMAPFRMLRLREYLSVFRGDGALAAYVS